MTSFDLGRQVLADLMQEENSVPRIKLENYLMVRIDIRQSSLLTLPAELPDGPSIGRAIDDSMKEDVARLANLVDLREKKKMIVELTEKLRSTYRRAINASQSYSTHLSWIRKLSLNVRDVEIRPTIHESYIFANSDAEKRLNRILDSKETIRRNAFRQSKSTMPKAYFTYPEDFDWYYALSMGELLGYPRCCIDAYIENRKINALSVEERASLQIEDTERKGGDVNCFAYFVRNFFPCKPTCESAAEIGKRAHLAFSQLDPSVGAMYLAIVRENAEYVKDCPRLIREFEENLIRSAASKTKLQ